MSISLLTGAPAALAWQDAPGARPAVQDIPATTNLPDLVKAHNQERTDHDLPPLVTSSQLADAAQAHARDMAAAALMRHEGSDGSTPGERIARTGYPGQKIAENVAYGYDDIKTLMSGWMNSPHHRDNILGDFTQIGVARAQGRDGQPYWAVEFGRPWPPLEPAAAAQSLLKEINQARIEADASPLRGAAALDRIAMAHAQANAQRGEVGVPDQPGGPNPLDQAQQAGYTHHRLGLSDASGIPSAAEVVSGWLGDDDSRGRLLGPATEAGVGYAQDKTGKPFWTLILAQPVR